MKLFTRIAVLSVFVLTLLVPATALAQEQCFGLSEADCALFYSAGSDDFTSFAFSYDFEMTIPETMSVTSTGEGTFTALPEVADPLKAFSLAVALEGSSTDEMGETESGTAEVRIIDGVLYVSDGTVWKYAGVEGLLSQLEELGIGSDMMMPGEMGAMEGMMGDMDATVANHVTMTRGEDSTVDGETAASFTVALDLSGLLADPGLAEMFANLPPEMLAGALGGGAEMTEEELQQMTAMMPMLVGMLGMMFQNTEAYLNVDVGVDSGKVYGFELHFATDLDASALGGGTGGEAISILFHIGVDINNYDGSFEYVVPEGATEMDMSELDMMGGMGF
jgi:hypothetical protein